MTQLDERQQDQRQNLLASSVLEIRRLRAEIDRLGRSAAEPVAIVGIGCRMPGSGAGPEAFWEFLRDGGDGIRDFPAERGAFDGYYDPTGRDPGASYTRRGGFLSDIDQFDAPFFNVSPREAASLDPQQRLLLEVAWEALEDAALSPELLAGSDTGVYLGIANHDYSQVQIQRTAPADLEAYWATSNASTFGAGRLSYLLGLHGPSLSVDTSCSSSLVAVHLAVQALRAGECSAALAGGVNVLLAPESFVVLSKTRALARDGMCKTFDQTADGYARGEGCGVIVLKLLADAVEAGDRILALIRGTAVNQDGRSSGITVPNPKAQQEVLRRALRAAGVEPARVGYIEAHGTGTPLGDPIELRALAAVLGERGAAAPLRVGSLKTNIGHLEPAAGIAGLIKAVLCLRHGQIPPHRNLAEVNPEIGIDQLGLEIPTRLTDWPRDGGPRIAGVSSFGASGTNAHAVLEEAPQPQAESESAAPSRAVHLLTLSAKSPDALAELAERYRVRLAAAAAHGLADLCFTANTGRAHFAHRTAVVGASAAELAERLADGAAASGHVRPGPGPTAAFLFTGQGAQYAGMAAELYESEPVFRELIEQADAVVRPLLGTALTEILADEALIGHTRYAQPALLAVEYALARLWMSWGVRPAAVLGHSVGELAAACVAGVLRFEDGLRLAAARGRLMAEPAQAGVMAAVFAGADVVEEALRPYAESLAVAAVNGPASVVVSGAEEALESALATLSERGVRTRRLPGDRAFHSPLLDPVLDAFEKEAAEFSYRAPQIPMISNVTGRPIQEVSAAYWREHARKPVQFLNGMTALFEQGHEVLVEIGPAPTLLGMAKRFAPDAVRRYVPSLRQGQDGRRVMLDGLAMLYTAGFTVDWTGLDPAPRRRVALPTYPFQRTRHWFQDRASQNASHNGAAGALRNGSAPPRAAAPPTALLGHRMPSPLEAVQYASQLSTETHRCLGDCVMDGLPVANIGIYLETAFAAVREREGTGPVVASGNLVLQGLVLDPDAPTDVQFHLAPDGAYRYYAQRPATDGDAADGPTGWIQHAQGVVRAEPSLRLVTDGTAYREDVREGLGAQLTGQDFYARLWRRKLYLGPSARWIDHIWHAGGEAIALMRAPEPGEAEPYLLHPGLTDAMFQTLFACLPADAPSDAAYALVGIDRFEFHGLETHTAPLYCRARLSDATDPQTALVAEVRLEDATGRLLVHATGVYAKRADRSAMLREGADHRPERAETAVSSLAAPRPHVRQSIPDDPAEREALVRGLVIEAVARALRTPAASIDPDQPLHNLGLDSLMALEVRDALGSRLGIAPPLVAFLEGGSARSVADALSPLLRPTTAQPTTPPTAIAEAQAAPALTTALPAIEHDAQSRYEPFGLTDLQQAYLVGRSNAFALGNISTYFYLEVDLEDLDVPRLADAWNRIVARHDMLRAVITADGLQRVLETVPHYDIPVDDLSALEEAERERRLADLHARMKNQVLDASIWPVFDIRASRLDGSRTRLHVGMDALTMDAWSTTVVFAEWAAAYRGEDDDVPAPAITFRDYVVASREFESSPAYEAAREYWRGRAETLPPAPDLPLARDPATVERPEFTHRGGRLDATEWSLLKQRAAAVGATPSGVLCTAYAQVLAAWSKSDRFTLNLLFFNRLPLHPDVPKVVGNFTATTLLEVDGATAGTFAERAARVQKQLWTDLEHSQVSGVSVLREIGRARGGGAGPVVMPVVFASTVNFGARENPGAATGLARPLIGMVEQGEERWCSVRTPQVWIDHQVIEDAGGAVLNWDSVDALFPPGLVDAMFAAYLDLVRDLCADETAWSRTASVLTPLSELEVRQDANATAAPLPVGLLQDGFAARAALHPDSPAVIAADRTLSYGELDAVSNQIAHCVREAAVPPGALVGVVMEKGWEQVAAVLGILKAGAAYVPIDAAVPAERLRLLLGTARITTVLTQPHVEGVAQWPDGTAVFSVGGPEIARQSVAAPPAPATRPDDLAYVIFTSGSTGVPKGVMIEHCGALNTIADINERFEITARDRVLALSALNFDLSVYDVFGLLAVGGAIVLPEPAAHREPARWAQLVAEHGVTVWNSVPMLAEMFAEHALASGARASALRVVMMSGDWIPVTLPGRLRELAPDAAVWSLGGATEASIWSILYPIERTDPGWTSVPYGKPMLNQRFHVLNDAMQPCPVWVPGQLYIAGAGLARGYLGDPAKTRAAFLRHPATGERLYRTGDLGRYLPDGNIEFLGREDFQVKVQGYRIELGEIEAALLRTPGVRAAAVTVLGGRHATKRLIGYAVLDKTAPDKTVFDDAAAPAVADDLLNQLGRELPAYMVPQRLIILDELPLSANGKVDRSALPAPDGADRPADAASAPRDEFERCVAEVWGTLFGTPPADVGTNFFELGGDSLLAVRAMARIEQRLGRALPVATLFTHPTVAQLARALRDAGADARRAALVPIRPGGPQPPLFLVHPVGGDVLCYAELAGLLGDRQAVYGLQVPDTDAPLRTVPELAAHYAAAVTAELPQGPYRLGGWSMGGVIALEMARQLAAAGAQVDLVATVDLLEPPGPRAEHPDEADLLAWFARDLAGLAGAAWTLPAEDLRRDDGRAPLQILHEAAGAAGVLPADVDQATLGRITERFMRNSQALIAHEPYVYGGTVRHFRARGGATPEVAAAWLEVTPGDATMAEVPGDHFSVMRSPALSVLADGLRTALDAIDPDSDPSNPSADKESR